MLARFAPHSAGYARVTLRPGDSRHQLCNHHGPRQADTSTRYKDLRPNWKRKASLTPMIGEQPHTCAVKQRGCFGSFAQCRSRLGSSAAAPLNC